MFGKQLYGILKLHTLETAQDGEDRWTIVLNKSAIRNGAMKELGVNTFALWLAISSYMDDDGFCCPTQRQLAEVLGWTQRTVGRNMNKLLQAEWNGLKLLTRSLEGNNIKHSEYNIVKSDSKSDVKRMPPKDILIYFDNKYMDTYGVDYQFSWSRESSMIKNKLTSNYTDDQIKRFIDVIFENYDQKWSNSKYPRPTVGALCTWLINEVMVVIQEEESIEQKIADSEPVDYTS